MSRPEPAASFAPAHSELRLPASEILFMHTSVEGRIGAMSMSVTSALGKEQDALLGTTFEDLLHPEMPGALMMILDQELDAGHPFCGYLRLQNGDGQSLWVTAHVCSVEGGRLWLFGPALGSQLSLLQSLYAELDTTEGDGVTADSARVALEALLDREDFGGLQSLMARIALDEAEARAKALVRPAPYRSGLIGQIVGVAAEAQSETDELLVQFDSIRGVPSNMRIVASRQEAAGGPISAISQNYSVMVEEIWSHLEGFRTDSGSSFVGLREAVTAGVLYLGASDVQAECLEVLDREAQSGAGSAPDATVIESLRTKVDAYRSAATGELHRIKRDVARLMRGGQDLKRLVAGLDMIRVLCKVEAGRLNGNKDGLLGIIRQLDAFHASVDERLNRIAELSKQIQTRAQGAVSTESSRD